MAGIRLFNVHRTWEDWVGMVLGVLIGLSPWLAGEQDHQVVMWNAVILSALVIALSALELSGLQRWEEAGALRYWQFALGAAVVLLEVIELWQDWKLDDKELAHHGQ